MNEEIPPTIELEHAIGFAGQPNSLYLHPNGREYVYLAGACVVIMNLSDAHEQQFLRGHDDNVTCLFVSRTGRWLVSGQRGVNANVCVWRFEDRALVFRLEEHDFGVKCVTMTDDEKLLLTVGEAPDGKVVVWDMSIGHPVCFTNTAELPSPVALVQWGGKARDIKRRETECYQYCVLAGNEVYYHVLNPMTGQQTVDKISTTTHVRRGTAAEFSPNGDVLFVGSESGDVSIYSLREKKLITGVTVCSGGVRCLFVPKRLDDGGGVGGGGGGFRYANFGNDDRSVTLYCSGGDGTVGLYHIADTQFVLQNGMDARSKLTVDGEVTSLSLSSDESYLLLGTTRGTVFRSILRPGQPPSADVFLEAPLVAAKAVAFHPFLNDRFATASADGQVRVWDSSSYRIVSQCAGVGPRGLARPFGGPDVGYSVKSQAHAPLGGAKRPPGAPGGAVPASGPHPVCLSYLGQMDVCLSAWSDGAIRAFDAVNGEFLWSVDSAHRCGITALVVAPNLKFFVTGGEEGEVRVWEMKTRDMVSELKEHKGMITQLKLMEDSSHLLSASKDKSVITWDLMRERRATIHEQKMGAVCGLDVYRNQANFVTVGLEKRVNVWDLRQPNPVASERYADPGNTDAYATVCTLSHDNRFLCTGGTDQLVRLWDASTLAPLERGVGHSGVVNDVRFSPDDRQVVSVGDDACVFLWNVYT